MDLIAFALRAEHEGAVTVELEDGQTEDRPKFGGGLLAVGDGDFNVGEQLEAGDGTIVVHAHDQRLVDLLDAYPPLKRVGVPAGAAAISPYERKTLDELHLVASLRDLPGARSMSRPRLEAALLAHDAELAAGVAPAAAAEAATAAADEPDGGSPGPDLDVTTLSDAALVAVLDGDKETFADAGAVEVPAALEELRARAAAGNADARDALSARGLSTDDDANGGGA
jgi:hypothetical protein